MQKEKTTYFYAIGLSYKKADAEVRAEGHGGTLYRGDEYFYQHSEREPGVTAGTAGRKE